MALDASIYHNAVPQAQPMPSLADAARNALNLSQLGMQNQMLQRQMLTNQAMRDAYARNTDADGNLNQQGYLSDLGKVNPMAAMQARQQFAQMGKEQADAQVAKMQAAHQVLSVSTPAMGYLLGLPDDQAAKAYPNILNQLKSQGVPTDNAPPSWDRGWARQSYLIGSQMKEGLENQLAQSEINKNNADQLKTGATELAQFKDDVLNASSRKETGALMTTRDRADRLLTLANAGAAPNETPDQRTARLNQTLPQLANEYSVGLASILQGGVPSDTLMKETGLDTLGSRIAELKQKYSAQPTAGNQGALINAYVEAAQKMRDFSAGRLGEITQRIRSAYPYANKYFAKQMDSISQPLTAPSAGGDQQGQTLVGNVQKGGFIPAAGASENAPPKNSAPASKFNAGAIVLYKGKHYRVGPDGDSLVPVGGGK